MAGEIQITMVGNLTADPEYKQGNVPQVRFTIAQTSRQYKDGHSQDGDTVYIRCTAWRDVAEHIMATLTKGMRVVAIGRIRQYTSKGNDGVSRTNTEMTIDDIGPSLRYSVAKVTRAQRDNFSANPAGGFNNPNQGVYGGPFAQQNNWGQPAQPPVPQPAMPAQQQSSFVDPWSSTSPASQPPQPAPTNDSTEDEPEF